MCIGVVNRIKGSSSRGLVSLAAVPLFYKDVVGDDVPGIVNADKKQKQLEEKGLSRNDGL